MGSKRRQVIDLIEHLVIVVAIVTVLILIAAVLSSCQTVEVAGRLGPDWWIGLEKLVLAFLGDILSIFDLVL